MPMRVCAIPLLVNTSYQMLPVPASMPPVIPALLPYCILRHIRLHKKTTIKLEKQFWAQIDMLAKKSGKPWQEWAANELENKPSGHGAASWLRVRCLQQSLKGQK